MTVENSTPNPQGCTHNLVVKLRAGASLVKIKPVFTPDSKHILVASGFNVKVFNVSSGECSLTFRAHGAPVISLCINPENSLQALSCSENGIVFKWDYSDGKALKKYKLSFDRKIVAFYAVPSCKLWFVSVNIKGTAEFAKVYSVTIKDAHIGQKVNLLSRVHANGNAVAIGPNGSYVAGVCENNLLVYDTKNKINRKHITGEVALSCVACHPSQYMLATGDINGRIIVWAEMLESTLPTRSLYHWHSLSLPDIVFSPEGTHLYSGGGESVLVKWDLNSEHKQVLPRLGLPICQLAVSPDNMYIVTAHVDNALQVINPHNVVVQVIQGLTRGHYHKFVSDEVLPTGMLYDARSKAVVMNGRPGHLQFYNIHEDKQLFHLDIVGQNYICQERDRVIINTDIIKAAIDTRGIWLATVEYRDDGETSPEARLKFWMFDETSQKFVLNTNIFLPHNKRINCLKFQPENSKLMTGEHNAMVVTTSDDNRFKIWTLIESQNDRVSWTCELMGYYKEMKPSEVCFSEDGSLFCVAFDHVATLWSSETITLKTALNLPQSTDSIRHVTFGFNSCRHLLVYHTDSMLVVWNVLSLSVLWSVSCRIQYLVADSLSDIMGAFTDERRLFIFKPSNPEPLSVVRKASRRPIISAIFVPLVKTAAVENCCWQQHSRLYFMNDNQELLTVGTIKQEVEDSEKIVLQPSPLYTPFGLLQAEHTVSDIKRYETKQLTLDLSRDEPREFLCPTNVNTVSLCETVLQDLLGAKSSSQCESALEEKRNRTSRKDSDTDSDSDSSIYEKQPEVTKMDTAVNVTPTSADFSKIKDYSFLLDYVKIK